MNSDSSEQSSGFWTLTRTSKLSKRRNSDLHDSKSNHRTFNICVVGLSGPDKDKGPVGIGKSCFCNRFVRSAADDYQTEHISVLSQSDFNGRVVNNDHWLYWGSVTKSCEGCDLEFHVVEQTEFVDDSCFQPFKQGKIEPYFKRCCNTKLISPEKLMYICKDQLGIEREYEQKYLNDGKVNIDGFLCLFDVSEVHGRNIDKQIEITNLILINLVKTKKPVVFVTTKHDEASDLLVAEAERLINQRDFRGIVPIVETSSQENVNVNMAFLVCAQMIDKTRARFRVPPYFEAYKNQLDLLNAAKDAYLKLIRSTVVDHKTSWQQVCIKLSHNPEFLQFTYLHGLDKATLLFKNHLQRLRDEAIALKTQLYLKVFPEVLDELVPLDISNNNSNSRNNNCMNSFPNNLNHDWDYVKEQLLSSPLFDKYFIRIPPEISWFDTDLLDTTDTRIPSDWLNSEDAYMVYRRRNIILETEQKRRSAKQLFQNLLSSIKISVGKPFMDLKSMFSNNPDLEVLTDQELFDIYVEFQNNLLRRARSDFQELLLENAEHLQPLTSSDKVIRQEDIQTINNILQHDERYQALDMFSQDKTLMMIRHLNFLHSQSREQCPSFPKCIEPETERILITRAKSIVTKYNYNKPEKRSNQATNMSCDIVIFGPRRPSQQLILALNVLNSRAPKESQYQITFTVFDNAEEVESQAQKFKQSSTKLKGCFGIFTNHRSLEHVNYTIGKFLMVKWQGTSDKNLFASPPIIILYAADITLDERMMLSLENDGQQLADKFKCPFMNVTAIDQYRQHQQNNLLNNNDQDSASQIMSECASLDYACVDAAFNVLKEAISRKVCFIELYNNPDLIPHQAFNPDAKILMCFLCGDPFCIETFLWNTFLTRNDCYVTSSRSLCIRFKTDRNIDRYIEIIITSYNHGAMNYRDELLHGFILVCSIQRKASIAILNSFSYNIPCIPVLILAINDETIQRDSDKLSREDDVSTEVRDEARQTAHRLKGFIEYIDNSNYKHNPNFTQESDLSIDPRQVVSFPKNIQAFFQNVIKKKTAIDKSYANEDVDVVLPTPANFDDEPTTPGKLDLSQFGNITNAIGKLNIQPKSSGKDQIQQSSKVSNQANQISQNLATDSPVMQKPDSPPQDSGFFKGHGKKTKNRAKDLRQNHGRAVAPPQLPGGNIITSKVDSDINKFPSIPGKYTHIADNDPSILDSNISPITKRLLRTTSKDHKVCELANSPCESDNDIPIDQLKHISRKQRPYRGMSLAPDMGYHSSLITQTADQSKSSSNSNDHLETISATNKPSHSLEAKIRNLDKLLASKPMPNVSGLAAKHQSLRSSSLDQENLFHNSPSSSLTQINDKIDKETKKDKKKLRDDEKMEKRRLKEEEKLRKEEKRQEKKLASKKAKSILTPETITEEGVPFFIKRCIEFIEAEGLEAEGIYRVPGNRAHVDAFVLKFKENPLMSIDECDIPVNAVATALKDFLSKKWGPIIPTHLMEELTEISGKFDQHDRPQALKDLINKLPEPNYKLLKYVISHFLKVSRNHSTNNMDSKNLAICWWPTLLPLHFSDMGMFEQMRPHLEDSIQTMIDRFDFIFENDCPISDGVASQ